MRIPKLSPPGWALAPLAIITIIMQIPNLYDPSAFMEEFQFTSAPAAQLIGKLPQYSLIMIP